MRTREKLKKLLDIEAYIALSRYSKGYKKVILGLTLLSTINAAIGVYMAIATKDLIDYAINKDFSKAIQAGLVFALLMVLEMAIDSYLSYKNLRVNTEMKNQLQLDFVKNIYQKNWLLISEYNTGDLSTRLYDDINLIIGSITYTIPSIIALAVQIIMGFAYLAYYDLTLALLTFTITPIAILLSMLLGIKLKKIQKNIQTEESTQRSKTNESFSNLTILKTFNYTDKNLDDIHRIQQRKFTYIKERNTISIIANIILSIGYNFGFFAAIAIGALRLATASISFGMLTAFVQLVGKIQGPLHYIALQIPSLIASFSSVERIEELKQLPNESINDQAPNAQLKPINIMFDQVNFSYIENTPVLKDINLQINFGEKIAIIGASGQGKTTLINILLALIEPNEGSVSLTLEDNATYPMTADFRHLFAYVSQTNMLFTGTIRDNFLLTETVSDEAIVLALRAACCTDFIENLEDGIDTMLLEDGLGLSQGQLQRLSIARALIHNRPFLIFDEATSSLDSDTENTLIENIKNDYKGITLIAITHREGLLSICDKVFRISSNRIESIV